MLLYDIFKVFVFYFVVCLSFMTSISFIYWDNMYNFGIAARISLLIAVLYWFVREFEYEL